MPTVVLIQNAVLPRQRRRIVALSMMQEYSALVHNACVWGVVGHSVHSVCVCVCGGGGGGGGGVHAFMTNNPDD